VLLFALILGGAAAAIGLVIKSRARTTTPDVPVVVTADAGIAADARAVIAVTGDAAPDAPDIVVLVDAGERVALRPTRDAATLAVPTPNGRGTIQIQVITKPEDATLYNGTTYTGPGGTNIEMPWGTKLEITCKKTGYKPGTVELVFDGKQEVALCQLRRIKICIDNIKNPFDDCELDPTKPIPPSPLDSP
jgi:hypothetical protein